MISSVAASSEATMDNSLSGQQDKNSLGSELYTQEIPKEYKTLIEKAGFVQIPTAYSALIVNNFYKRLLKLKYQGPHITISIPDDATLSDAGKKIKQRIDGNVVVDLASSTQSCFRAFVEKQAPKTYIGVDLATPDKREKKAQGAEFLQIQSDILAFVSRIRSEAYDLFFLSGLDGTPTRTPEMTWELREKYIQALTKETARALKPGGACMFGANNTFDNHLLWKGVQKEGLQEVPLFEDKNRFNLETELEEGLEDLAAGKPWSTRCSFYGILKDDPTYRPAEIRTAYLFEKPTKLP